MGHPGARLKVDFIQWPAGAVPDIGGAAEASLADSVELSRDLTGCLALQEGLRCGVTVDATTFDQGNPEGRSAELTRDGYARGTSPNDAHLNLNG
jgi:hypothetical protein